jgi:ribonucleoside-diphosphate reductase alpha chain
MVVGAKLGDIAEGLKNADGRRPGGKGAWVPRVWTRAGTNPLDEVAYERRDSKIAEPDGRVVFEVKDIEVPASWSQLAADILASKYFRRAGVPGVGHETSIRQVVHRIAHTMRTFGEAHGYFDSKASADAFEDELSHLLVTQKGAFNSPVWFNCGLSHDYGIKGQGGNWAWDFTKGEVDQVDDAYSRPQCSACFIQSVGDDLMSIFDLVKSEARIFKYGSGTGTNFSKVRARDEKLSGGGTSSGLMSFLKVLDTGAGATKSGGTTRRAAKMVILDMDHPDIETFINWKVKEEEKVWALIQAGYDSNFNGEAYQTVSGQNSNNSVRISDAFMEAVLHDGEWQTHFRTSGKVAKTYKARDLMNQIAKAAWACADPGVQFDDNVNRWHPCSNTDRINASNPCSEYMFLDDSACNLASINLMKFLSEDGKFDIEGYRHAIRVLITAQEIAVDLSSYPTQKIAQNSHDYRPLGLGYANLGTMLMVLGTPYDSDKGRAIAGALTAILTGHAYRVSAELADVVGAFPGYAKNKEPFLRVMKQHRAAAHQISERECPPDLLKAAHEDWDDVVRLGEVYGFRNAQATVIAPTGTIGLLMDCDTTGVEPDFSLVKWKKLAGGGHFKIVNQSIPRALKALGYSPRQVDDIIKHILGHSTLEGAPHISPRELLLLGFNERDIAEAEKYVRERGSLDDYTPSVNPKSLAAKGITARQVAEAQAHIGGTQTVEGAPHMKPEHVAVFDCANKCGTGSRFIDPMGHVRMMAAAQPFISGAISKTVNLPEQISVEAVEKLYIESWRLGLKAVALYRDGSKHSQPLNTKNVKDKTAGESKEEAPGKADADAGLTAIALRHGIARGDREVLPAKRHGFTIESSVGGHKVFLRTGEYDDGRLGEIFVDMYKEGAAYRSLMNCFAISVSIGLQYGVPLEKYVNSFTFTRFEPQGMTDHPNVKVATSIPDFIFRVLGMEYLGRTDFVHLKPKTVDEDKHGGSAPAPPTPGPEGSLFVSAPPKEKPLDAYTEVTPTAAGQTMDDALAQLMGDAPPCDQCGHTTVRNGTCYKCINCGNSMGCS